MKQHLNQYLYLKKKALRTITFSEYDSPSSPLFKSLQVIKFHDLVTFHIATFMYKFHNQLLPTAFYSFFTKVTNIHNYNTRLAAKQSYYLPSVRTNYGKFNIRFQGPSIWNSIDKDIKSSSKATSSSIYTKILDCVALCNILIFSKSFNSLLYLYSSCLHFFFESH